MDAETWLSSLDPIGWRFGLERMTHLLAKLGDPQRDFASIHVVGTNGKSSVTLMTAALLEAAGRTTGAYLSPHSESWAERVVLSGSEISAGAFERAATTVADAVTSLEREWEEDERITQFEAATALAFQALANAEVEFGVIEAGLGGRLDATNVLDSRVTVLSSVGLDHTQWLGDTERDIAAEKLAVLRPGSTLVLGVLAPEIQAQAREVAAERGCVVIDSQTSSAASYKGPRGTFGLRAPYLQRNLRTASTAAEAIAGDLGDEVVEQALHRIDLPGRFELAGSNPPVVRDAAHNPDGAAALAEALRAEVGERPVIGCLAVLGDKDAAGIVRALAPALAMVVCTEIPAERLEGAGRPGTASTGAAELARLFEAAGVSATATIEPREAIGEALGLARTRGGVALIAGSHYLLNY